MLARLVMDVVVSLAASFVERRRGNMVVAAMRTTAQARSDVQVDFEIQASACYHIANVRAEPGVSSEDAAHRASAEATAHLV